MPFEYPHIAIGDKVEVSNDPSRSDRVLGQVAEANNGCADISFISSDGVGLRRDCWYEGDPRCVQHPGHFDSSQGPPSGVFSLCESELRLREVLRRLDALDANQAVLAADQTVLVADVAKLKEPKPARRGPGRPRKQSRELVGETA